MQDIKTIRDTKLNETERRVQSVEAEIEETTNNVVQCRLENDKIANMINTLNGI